MVERLAIFGATGDLTARYLLPGLAALRAAGRLGDRFRLTGAGREDWDTAHFRHWGQEQLGRHAGGVPAAARQAVVSAADYRRADVSDQASVAAVIAGSGPVAAYLALPPAVFPATVTALHEAGLAAGSRIVLEKPFGAWSSPCWRPGRRISSRCRSTRPARQDRAPGPITWPDQGAH